jgi:hypothetical protein
MNKIFGSRSTTTTTPTRWTRTRSHGRYVYICIKEKIDDCITRHIKELKSMRRTILKGRANPITPVGTFGISYMSP